MDVNVGNKRLVKLQTIIETALERHARFVSKNAWKIVFLSVLVNALFGLCLLSLELNNDIDDLYISRNTETDSVITELSKYFPDRSGDNFFFHSSVKPTLHVDIILSTMNESTILPDADLREEINLLVWYIGNISVSTWSNVDSSYETVCARRDQKCVIAGPKIALLQDHFEVDTIISDDWISEVISGANSSISSGHWMKLTFYLRQDTDSRRYNSEQWQNTFKHEMFKFKSNRVKFFFSHSRSFLEELNEDTYPDIKYFSFAFTILITYCSFLVSGGDCVSKRVHLCRMGIIVVPLSVLGAWGFLCGIGQTFTNMVGVLPYFLLFHEVNNMSATLSALSAHLHESSAIDRVGKAIRTSGIPITVTMVTHVVAFSVSIYSNFLAVEIFSKYTVATLLCVYINHMTFFVACLAIHERRIDASRHCCTCQIVTSSDHPDNNDRSCCFRCCCTGKKPSSSDQLNSSLLALSQKLFSKTILLLPVKVIFCLGLIAFVGINVWKVLCLDIGTFIPNYVTKESYYSKFYEVDSTFFIDKQFVTIFVTGPLDFTTNTVPRLFFIQFQKMKELPFVQSNESIFWLHEFMNYSKFDNQTNLNFSKTLKDEFLQTHPIYSDDIVFDSTGDEIKAFRFYAQLTGFSDTKSVIKIKQAFKDFCGHAFGSVTTGIEVKVHSPYFKLSDSANAPFYGYLQFSGTHIAIAAVLILIFGRSVFTSFQVIIWYCIGIIGLLGLSVMFAISITPVSMILLIIGGCYFIEVVIYTYWSFMNSCGTGKAPRAHNVLLKTTPTVFNTTLGTFFGLLVLFVEKSYVFITVFKVLAISSAVACVFAFSFIPVVLSFLGPDRLNYGQTSNSFTRKCLVSTVYKDNSSSQNKLGLYNLGHAISDDNLNRNPTVNNDQDVRL